MAPEASFEAEFDADEMSRVLADLSKRLSMMTRGLGGDMKLLSLFSAVVYRDVITHFREEEGPDGPWAAWSEAYDARMRARGRGGNKILQDSGHLRQAFQPSSVRSAKEGLVWFNNATTRAGFPYAFAHDEGGGQLPQREFMWLSDAAMDKIAEVGANYLEGE